MKKAGPKVKTVKGLRSQVLTASRPHSKKPKAPAPSSKAIDAFKLAALVEAAGFNASLPSALFDQAGNLIFSNARMNDLLAISGPFPLGYDQVQILWPFENEEKAGPAVFSALLGAKTKEVSMTARIKLKNYKISQCAASGTEFRLVVAELQRSGDLLKDKNSRQTLFRSLSHEIRTAVSTLQGYTAMISSRDAGDVQIVGRMNTALARLEKVVDRMHDLKAELEES